MRPIRAFGLLNPECRETSSLTLELSLHTENHISVQGAWGLQIKLGTDWQAFDRIAIPEYLSLHVEKQNIKQCTHNVRTSLLHFK
jgi:hypothetical protein